MDQHGIHTQLIRHAASELAARSAKTGERIGGDIVPACSADLADRIGHFVHREGEKSFGQIAYRHRLWQIGGDFLQPRP